MKISSNIKKIISIMMCCVVVLMPCLTTSAKGEAGDWGDDTYHEAYEDFSDSPKYSTSDLVYTGEVSQNLTTDFNMIQQFGMDWTTDSKFYMSRPFSFRKRWSYENSLYLNFGSAESDQNKMFMKEKFNSIASSAFVTSNNINMSDYDVYYTVRSSYAVSNEYGYLTLDYWFIPEGRRIAISNQNHPEDDVDYTKVWYGIWFASESDLDETYKLCWHYSFEIRGETGDITTGNKGFMANPFYSFLGRSHLNLIATNIPVFTQKDSAKQYVVSGSSTEDPSNKVVDDKNVNNMLSASSFSWQSFDCSLVQDGNSYKFIYKYVPKTDDMKKNSSDYYFTCDYSQNVKYKVLGQTNDLYKSKSSNLSKENALDSGGTTINTFKELGVKVYDGSDDGTSGSWFRFALYNLLGSDVVQGSADILSSYLYVTITLHHKRFETDNNALKPVKKMMNDVSSDVRHFKYDAITGKLLDSSDITSDVVTKDLTDDDGNVITDSNGNPIKQVTQITTNDNSTHTTINNYYYDSNGKQSSSSDGSDTLSNILSTLIKFIKTLVTEGLPAALEILQTLIKSLSSMISSALDGLNVGAGTTNGIIAVLKCIPASCWSLVVIAVIILVVIGVLKHIF